MSKSETIKMRVNVAGFAGGPVTMFAVFDPSSDTLLVAKTAPYESQRRDGFLLITMQDRDEAHDAVFPADMTRDAIRGFFEMRDLRLLQFGKGMDQHNPENRIERDGMDEGGIVYRFGPDITSAMVATVIAAHYAKQQRVVAATQDMAVGVLMLDDDRDEDDDMHRGWD